jgi:arginase
MKDIDRAGIAAVMEEALAIAGRDTAGLHVSFDLDVCDPMADSDRLIALDMVELNPILDVRNATAVLGTELVLSAVGQKIL